MNIALGVIVGLLVLTLLIVLHEGGHFIMARRNGVRVKEFGIGFPPRAIAWVKGADGKWHRYHKKDWQTEQKGLIFSINWLPIGGFCAMDGESDADTRKGTFGAASFWQKTKILFGGVFMNWLTAIVIFTVLAITGMPRLVDDQFFIESDTTLELHPVIVADIMEGSPAVEAGFLKDEYIIAASATDENGNAETIDVTDSYTLIDFNERHADETVEYTVYSPTCVIADCVGDSDLPNYVPEGYKKITRKAKLNPAGSEYGLGVGMRNTGQSLYHSTWSAPIVGIVTTAQLTGETFKGLGAMIGNLVGGIINQFSSDEQTRTEGQEAIQAAGDSVTGPVGILGVLFPSFVSSGLTNVAFLAAIISISLACMNVLPIPALDGGRWLLIALFKIRRKPLDTETETRIVSRAMLVILALAVLITILDIIRIAQ